MRLSVDVGFDISWANKKGELGLIKSIGGIDKELIHYKKIPNVTYNLGFDIYSPQSNLGFYVAANINKQEYAIHSTSNKQLLDSISSINFEIPIYLKFRLGKVLSKSHLWIALGGGYSIPTKTNSTSYLGQLKISESDNKELFKATPFLSSIIGYEFLIPSGTTNKQLYDRDNFRVLLFAKGNYDLKNRFNQDSNFQDVTSLGQSNNPDLKFLRISFGIKILMRISKLNKMVNESIMKNIKN